MNRIFVVLLVYLFTSSGCASKDTDILERFCSPADNLNWVNGEEECLRIKTKKNDEWVPWILGEKTNNKVDLFPTTTLIIYLHGDVCASGPSDYLRFLADHIRKDHVTQVVLIRPGYYDSEYVESTGVSYRKARRGTSYNARYVKEIALAIKNIKNFHKPEKVLLVGHSGGAAISAVIMGLYPEVADGAILAACPCNVKRWAQILSVKCSSRALSPHNYVEYFKEDVQITAITGDKDKNTLPILAKNYIDLLKKRNINAKFIEVPGENHNSIIRSREIVKLINLFIE